MGFVGDEIKSIGMQVNEEEDRRRLKEKLKEALESARRNHQLDEEMAGEVHTSRQLPHLSSTYLCHNHHLSAVTFPTTISPSWDNLLNESNPTGSFWLLRVD